MGHGWVNAGGMLALGHRHHLIPCLHSEEWVVATKHTINMTATRGHCCYTHCVCSASGDPWLRGAGQRLDVLPIIPQNPCKQTLATCARTEQFGFKGFNSCHGTKLVQHAWYFLWPGLCYGVVCSACCVVGYVSHLVHDLDCEGLWGHHCHIFS